RRTEGAERFAGAAARSTAERVDRPLAVLRGGCARVEGPGGRRAPGERESAGLPPLPRVGGPSHVGARCYRRLLSPLAAPFVAIDFETADHGRDSACAVALVRVERGRIVRRETRRIRPPRSRFFF